MIQMNPEHDTIAEWNLAQVEGSQQLSKNFYITSIKLFFKLLYVARKNQENDFIIFKYISVLLPFLLIKFLFLFTENATTVPDSRNK